MLIANVAHGHCVAVLVKVSPSHTRSRPPAAPPMKIAASSRLSGLGIREGRNAGVPLACSRVRERSHQPLSEVGGQEGRCRAFTSGLHLMAATYRTIALLGV